MGRAVLAITLATVLWSRSVAAQDATPRATAADRATATALFDAARELMDAGDYAAACPKLQEARKLVAGTGIVYKLAECFEATGKTASAWGLFREATSLAENQGQTERASDARQRAAKLERMLTRIAIVVDPRDASPQLIITLNDKPVGRAQWNIAAPVDPGHFTIVATRPGYQPWRSEIDVLKESEVVKVTVPSLLADGEPPPPEPIRPPEDDAASTVNTWQVPLGVSLLVVGAGGLVLGGVLGLVAKSNADDAACDDNDICATQEAVDARDAAVNLGNAATAVMIVGGVVAGAGLVVWLTAPSRGDVALGLSPTAATLRVSF